MRKTEDAGTRALEVRSPATAARRARHGTAHPTSSTCYSPTSSKFTHLSRSLVARFGWVNSSKFTHLSRSRCTMPIHICRQSDRDAAGIDNSAIKIPSYQFQKMQSLSLYTYVKGRKNHYIYTHGQLNFHKQHKYKGW